MSVVNKMLRDLDTRAQARGSDQAAPAVAASLVRGTTRIDVSPLRAPRRHVGSGPAVWAVAAMVACGAAALWWYGRTPGVSSAAGVAVAPMVPAVVVPGAEPTLAASGDVTRSGVSAAGHAAAGAPLAAASLAQEQGPGNVARIIPPSVAATHDASHAAIPGAPTLVAPPAVGAVRAAGAVSVASAAGAAGATGVATAAGSARAASAAGAVRLAGAAGAVPALPQPTREATARNAAPTAPVPVLGSIARVVPALESSAAPIAAPAAGPPVLSPVRWQEAALDTVAQAQRLWAAGSRETALELLREALSVIERTHGAELPTSGAAATLATVRELARMELAQGRGVEVLALLERHRQLLPGRADLWALRANAAQRVGQHAEASLAYRTALDIRPGEARWMLGAAVSMAALGQLAAAADMVDQARQVEDGNPEVLAYLRRLGVPMRERQ